LEGILFILHGPIVLIPVFVFRRGGVNPLPSLGIEDSLFFQEQSACPIGCGRGLTLPYTRIQGPLNPVFDYYDTKVIYQKFIAKIKLL
jgi:hypothetical protein